MHQALKTFEILDAIFSYLRDYPPEGYHDHHFPCDYSNSLAYNPLIQENLKSRRALFRSALCCKHFSSLALKHLRWNQGSIQNILKLLPGYAFHGTQNYIEIDGFLDEEDWERADMYAKLVKRFMINNQKGPKIEKSTYHQIQASRKSRTLFPNLREIYCRGRWEEVCLFLSPSLCRVVFLEDKFFNPSSPAISTFINAMPKICPDVQSLEAYVDLPSSAMRSVQKLQKLQYLGLQFVESDSSNIDHMTGISLLPNLRLLQLSWAGWADSELQKFLPIFHSPEAFCALQQLDFLASLESIATWLSSFISPNLTSFTAEIEATWNDEDENYEITAEQLCYKLCNTLVKHARSPSSSLRTLLFMGKSYDVLHTEVEAFQPLLALRGLETLVFDIPLSDFDDQTLIKWAKAWSNLKTFKVSASSEDSITLSGVITLLQLCRDLKNLKLAFDATTLDLIPEIPPTRSLRHGLKDWDISVSQVTRDTLGPVIAVLSWVFLDMWDVKCRRCQLAGKAASEVLPHSLERIAI